MSKNQFFTSPIGIGIGIGLGAALGGVLVIGIRAASSTIFKYGKGLGKGDSDEGGEADDVGKGVSDNGSDNGSDDGSADDDESVDNRGSSFFNLDSAFEDTNRDSVKSTGKDNDNSLTSLRREFKPKQGPFPYKRVKGGKHSKKRKRKGKSKKKGKNKFRTLKKV